jgi:hypothetical protein
LARSVHAQTPGSANRGQILWPAVFTVVKF